MLPKGLVCGVDDDYPSDADEQEKAAQATEGNPDMRQERAHGVTSHLMVLEKEKEYSKPGGEDNASCDSQEYPGGGAARFCGVCSGGHG